MAGVVLAGAVAGADDSSRAAGSAEKPARWEDVGGGAIMQVCPLFLLWATVAFLLHAAAVIAAAGAGVDSLCPTTFTQVCHTQTSGPLLAPVTVHRNTVGVGAGPYHY